MRYRVLSLLVLAWLAMYASSAPSSLLAQSYELPIVYHSATPPHPPPSGGADSIALMIELADPPAIAGDAHARAIADRSARNRAAQARLLPLLAALDAQILFRTSLVYNGIAVSVPKARVAGLLSLPAVAGIHVIPPKQPIDVPAELTAAASALDAAVTWNSPLGATGDHVRVGVIDTGIDYTHATFGGPGTSAAYQAINPAQPAPNVFPNAKVVGGYDFAGDKYDAGTSGATIPQPDPNPLDCNGHGTRVASVLAGFGVTSQRKTYTGSYMGPLNVQYFRVAPGIAPRSSVYALKIFGCSGSSALLTQAVEWALDPNGDGDPSDHLDVLNISLGTPFGSNDDPDAIAISNAAAAGMTVVSSAGNLNGAFFAIASPGSAQRAITVGASSTTLTASAGVHAPSVSVLPDSARGPQRGVTTLKPDLLAPGNAIVAAQVGSGSNAVTGSGPDIAVPQVAGAVALLRQLYPTWTNAQIKAALMSTALPVQASDVPAPPSLSGAGELNVLRLGGLDFLAYGREGGGVSFGVAPLSRSTVLEQSVTLENLSDKERTVAVNATAAVTETGVAVDVPGTITVPPHSTVDVPVRAAVTPSALGHTPDAATARQQSDLPRYFLAEHGGAVEVTASIGTRLRPGHVADLPPVAFYLDDNLITGSIRTDNVDPYVTVPSGTHTIRVVRAGQPASATPIITQTVTLQPDQDYTVILVGREKVFGLDMINSTPNAPPSANTALLQFTNANVSVDAHSGPFDVYLDGNLATTALAASASTGYMPIPAGKHVVTFYPTGKAPVFNNLNAISEFDAQAGETLLVRTDRQGDEYYCPDRNRLCQAQQRGGLTRAPIRVPEVAARVPYNIFPQSASEAHAAQQVVTAPAGSQTFTLPLQNTGARNSGVMPNGFPGPQTPLVSAFELQAASPPIAPLSANLSPADIQYVGVTNDYALTQSAGNTDLFFGTASYGAWSTPHEVQIRIYLDVNNDGVDDYVLLNTDYGTAFGQAPNDVFIHALYRIQPDGTLTGLATFSFWGTLPAPSVPDGADVAAFNSSVMFQAVNTQSLGLAAGQTRLSYHVETRARDASGFGTVIDRVPATGSLSYDIASAAVVPVNTAGLLRQRPLFVDTDGGSVTGYAGSGSSQPVSQGLLLLHHHNVFPYQAEVVDVRRPATLQLSPRLYIPLATRDW
jgi:hypothetical protein